MLSGAEVGVLYQTLLELQAAYWKDRLYREKQRILETIDEAASELKNDWLDASVSADEAYATVYETLIEILNEHEYTQSEKKLEERKDG